MNQKTIVDQRRRRQIRRIIRESFMERKILLEQREMILEKVDNINYDMSSRGHSPKIIEEGIFDILGGGMASAFKQQAVEYIADMLGFETDTIGTRFLVNFLEEFNILGMGKYFDEGKCKEVPALVAKAAIETITELEGAKLLEMVYFAITGEEKISDPELFKRFDTGMGSLIKAAGREIVNEVIYSFIGPMIEPKIEAIFCKYDGLKDFLIRGVYQGEAGEDMKDLAKGGAIAGAAGLGIDAALDAGDEALQGRDDAARRGSGADLASQIFGEK